MKQALLVIDFIEGIAESGTCADFLAAHPEVIANTNRLIGSFREQGDLITHVRLAFDSYDELPSHAPNRSYLEEHQKFLLGQSDAEFIQEIDVQEGDLILNKKYGDPFYKSGLLDVLKKHSIEEVVFTGIATDNAILLGANSAMTSGYFVTVVTDAVGAKTEEAHNQALTLMKGRSVNRFVTALQKDES